MYEELSVRLSHRVFDLLKLPYGLPIVPEIKGVIDLYSSSFDRILESKKPTNSDDVENFTNLLEDIKNKHTNTVIRIDHRNPLEQGMEDWIKVLIIRDPIDRFISHFNHSKMKYWRKHKIIKTETIDEYIESNGHESNKPSEFKYWSYLDWLNVQQSRSGNELVDGAQMLFSRFTIDKVKEFFGKEYDINMKSVRDLISNCRDVRNMPKIILVSFINMFTLGMYTFLMQFLLNMVIGVI